MVPKTIQFSSVLIYKSEYVNYNYFNTLAILEFVLHNTVSQ